MGSDMELGQILRQLRTDRGEPLRVVAAAAGVDSTLLSRIERGERLPTSTQIAALAAHFAVDCEHLETLATASRLLRRHPSESVLRAADLIEARVAAPLDWTESAGSPRRGLQDLPLGAPGPSRRGARSERLAEIEDAAAGARDAIGVLAEASADADSVVALRARELLRQVRAAFGEPRDPR